MNEEKLSKLGYKGAINPFAIHAWLIIEKKVFAEVYFSLFHKQWSIQNYLVDVKKAQRMPWTDGKLDSYKFDTYKSALEFAVLSTINML